jgi:hypothetical protein
LFAPLKTLSGEKARNFLENFFSPKIVSIFGKLFRAKNFSKKILANSPMKDFNAPNEKDLS